MSDGEEWGEWQEHDGRGCPCRGAFVESVCGDGLAEQHIAGAIGPEPGCINVDCWDWLDCFLKGAPHFRIVRYRIRKPRGLTILEDLLEKLPVPEKETA